jgi:hypothetical protein
MAEGMLYAWDCLSRIPGKENLFQIYESSLHRGLSVARHGNKCLFAACILFPARDPPRGAPSRRRLFLAICIPIITPLSGGYPPYAPDGYPPSGQPFWPAIPMIPVGDPGYPEGGSYPSLSDRGGYPPSPIIFPAVTPAHPSWHGWGTHPPPVPGFGPAFRVERRRDPAKFLPIREGG